MKSSIMPKIPTMIGAILIVHRSQKAHKISHRKSKLSLQKQSQQKISIKDIFLFTYFFFPHRAKAEQIHLAIKSSNQQSPAI